MSRGRGDLACKYLYNNDLSGVRDGFNGTRRALKLGQFKSYCHSFNLELGQDKLYCHSFTLELGQFKLARPSLNRAGSGLRGHRRETSALGRRFVRGAFLEATGGERAKRGPAMSRRRGILACKSLYSNGLSGVRDDLSGVREGLNPHQYKLKRRRSDLTGNGFFRPQARNFRAWAAPDFVL